jgi:chemotaxis protein MotB
MNRRRAVSLGPHALRASGDRWLFGYADVVTLLFACFAALYAAKLAPPVLDIRLPKTPPAPVAVPAPPPSPLAQALARVLGREATLPGIDVATGTRGLTISLPEAGSFPPGRSELSDAARAVMLDLAHELQPLPNQIRVEGHTDDVPIHTPQFASNWELSTARATTVVQFLIEAGGLDPARLAAAGYGEYRPRIDNDTPEARARNRRVDIVVLDPEVAAREEPVEVR